MDDRLKINECFYHFKTLVRRGGKPMLQNMSKINESAKINKENISEVNEEDQNRYKQEIDKLRLLLQCRDN